jgi:hypothetical protein
MIIEEYQTNICLNKTYSNLSAFKLLSDAFPIDKVLEQGDALS